MVVVKKSIAKALDMAPSAFATPDLTTFTIDQLGLTATGQHLTPKCKGV